MINAKPIEKSLIALILFFLTACSPDAHKVDARSLSTEDISQIVSFQTTAQILMLNSASCKGIFPEKFEYAREQYNYARSQLININSRHLGFVISTNAMIDELDASFNTKQSTDHLSPEVARIVRTSISKSCSELEQHREYLDSYAMAINKTDFSSSRCHERECIADLNKDTYSDFLVAAAFR